MSSVPHEGCNSENPTWAKFKKNFATNFNDNIDNDHRYTQGSCTRSRKGQYGNIKRKDGHGAMSTTDWTDKWTRLRVWEDKVERCTLLAQKETTRRIVGRKAIQYCVKTARGPRRRLTEYQVIGRHLPSEANPAPKLYRMRIFAPNTVVAKSRFWYFLMKLRKVKKANGEIVSLNVIHEKRPMKVKNFGIWIRYDSRSGTHNMYKEYREMSRTDAVEAMYQDMAARHRSRFRSVHILKVVELEKTDDVKRPYIKQLLTKDLKFPLPHRVSKATGKKIFSGSRPSTFY
ncbi:hypothetical protein IFR04_004386 [Cadophora malorum]|uniref:Large ribosomal subunit protein eL20 domain-containing protein n=1 Tax=Cadophora malorum TaxID=108018 RepID=A0A8H7WCV6_9HELO|nr:hypothetical protein IFR04_004386 [Cadophora malorum]